MAQYNWDQFSQYLRRNPQFLPRIGDLLQYLTKASYEKWCADKTAEEFGKFVLFVWEDTTLSQDAVQFLAQKVFPYLQAEQASRLMEKIENFPTDDAAEAIRVLGKIIDSSPQTKKPGTGKIDGPQEVKPVRAQIRRSVPANTPMDGALREAIKEETFCIAGAAPTTSFWTKLFPQKKNSLLVAAPLHDQELESLRVETLVSVRAATLPWISLPEEKDLLASKAKDVLKIVTAMAGSHNLSREQQQSIQQVKNAMLVRTKLLTQSEIVLNIINQGMRSFQHTLDRISQVVGNKKINKKLREHLQLKAEEQLAAHGTLFRKQLESCQGLVDFENLMERYPLESHSTVKYYADIRIIRSVKLAYDSYARAPEKLTQILNKHMGVHGEVNIKAKLSQLLLTSTVDLALLKKIERESNLSRLIDKLNKIQSHPQATIHVKKLYQLLKGFADPECNSTLAELKAGLNELSPPLAKKIHAIARQSIQREVQREAESILKSRADTVDALQRLENLPANPRYHDPGLTLYGYTVENFGDKLNSIDSHASNLEYLIQHVFPSDRVPKELHALILSAKKEQLKAGKKSVESCLKQIRNLQTRIAKHDSLQLRIELLNLLQSHGKVEFSQDPGFSSVNGYALANLVTAYYNVPNRTTITLPEYIIPAIREPLKEMIDEERKRQLKKLGQ